MNQIHDRVLGVDATEREIDDLLEEKMFIHGGWIQLEHLDFPAAKLNERREEDWLYSAINGKHRKQLFWLIP